VSALVLVVLLLLLLHAPPSGRNHSGAEAQVLLPPWRAVTVAGSVVVEFVFPVALGGNLPAFAAHPLSLLNTAPAKRGMTSSPYRFDARLRLP